MRFSDMKPEQRFLKGECLCKKSGEKFFDGTQPYFSYIKLSGLDEDDRIEICTGSFDGEELDQEYEAVWLSKESYARHEVSNERWLVYRDALVTPVAYSKRMTQYQKVKSSGNIAVLHGKMDSLSPVYVLHFELV
jgi:hypothetical protein